MGKSMARIQNGVVTNIEWVSDSAVETSDLKNVYDVHIRVGDTYSNGRYYRDGVKILSFRERTQNMVTDYDAALTEIESIVPSMFSLRSAEPLTLEDRKQNVLNYLTELVAAANEGGTE